MKTIGLVLAAALALGALQVATKTRKDEPYVSIAEREALKDIARANCAALKASGQTTQYINQSCLDLFGPNFDR